MEEFYLLSDGKLTESYTSINPKDDKFEIIRVGSKLEEIKKHLLTSGLSIS